MAAEASPRDESAAAYIQVTATRVPEDVELVPASITIISGQDIRDRGARDLAGALALAAGVSIAPGGDGGPSASVPEIWGLREFDAFLLVVDGVPWGGAFNPALASLNLNGVDRIEVLRGAAPVMYGATSFVGVIHVIHTAPGSGERAAQLSGGSNSSGDAAATLPLPQRGEFRHSLDVDAARLGFRDDRTELGRGHLLYRAAARAGGGQFHLDFDASALRQDPASPHPLAGDELAATVPLDANHNPQGARIDEDRFHLAGGYDREIGKTAWSTMLALTHTRQNSLRGFLTDLTAAAPDGSAFTQNLAILDAYFDSHVAFKTGQKLRLVAGVDHLYGRVRQDSQIFDYFIPLDGSHAPSIDGTAPVDEPAARDRRNFSGLYVQGEWTPVTRLRINLGARLNHTEEVRAVPDVVPATDTKRVTRGSGTAGISWLAWRPAQGGVWLFADYRDSFKPAAFDFGPDANPDILNPETAQSYEAGAKGRLHDGRVTWEVSAFQMDFANLVVAHDVGGLPQLTNAGQERFRGIELCGSVRVRSSLHLRAGYSLHDARFRDFIDFDNGAQEDFSGRRLELSARNMASAGLVWAPARGFIASATVDYVGSRFLDRGNDAVTDPYSEWDAGFGYRFAVGTLRIDGSNLGNTRAPVSESELGPEQYYRMPARRLVLTWARHW